jgi:hypothetical protein
MSTAPTVEQLEDFFKHHIIPVGTQLDSGASIINPETFLAAQLHLYRNYGDTFQGKLCRDRLLRVKELLESAENKTD